MRCKLRGLLLLFIGLLGAGLVIAASTPFDGRILSRSGSGGGFTIARNWGTPIKGTKVVTITIPPNVSYKDTVTSGTRPTTTLVVGLVRVSPSLRNTSSTQAMAQVTTDTTKVILAVNATTTLTYNAILVGI